VIAIRRAVPADAPAMSAVLIASITELCVADHKNDPAALASWLANKTPEGVGVWFTNPANTILVAERNGEIAACGAYNTDRKIILNLRLAASPICRREQGAAHCDGSSARSWRGDARFDRDGEALLCGRRLGGSRPTRALSLRAGPPDAEAAGLEVAAEEQPDFRAPAACGRCPASGRI
jgi:hypothetical protein